MAWMRSCVTSRQVKASHRWWVRNKLHYPAISPEQGASKIVKISQQMAKLCRKLNWLVFFWDTVYISNEFGFYTSLPQTCVRFFGWEMSGIWKITWWKARKGPASRGRWAEKCPSVLLLGVNANDVSDEFFHLKIVCTLHDSATKYKLRPMARLFAYGSCKIKCSLWRRFKLFWVLSIVVDWRYIAFMMFLIHCKVNYCCTSCVVMVMRTVVAVQLVVRVRSSNWKFFTETS